LCRGEKEGFLAILEAARMAERFDVALMSTKGMSVTASRQLIDALAAMGVRVYVLHDFDISGFSIRKTFTESGRRHEFKNRLDYVDIGLRLADVERLSLQGEPVPLNRGGDSDKLVRRRESRINRLTINGAGEDEIGFLLGDADVGQRVELNAMTSDVFVASVEEKLAEHGAAKVVPDASILANAYRRLHTRQASGGAPHLRA
jgi:DNA topoisomerase VI subunit A